MAEGDTFTMDGVYEREGWFTALKRRLGFPMPPRGLQKFVVVAATPGLTYYKSAPNPIDRNP